MNAPHFEIELWNGIYWGPPSQREHYATIEEAREARLLYLGDYTREDRVRIIKLATEAVE